MSTHQTVLLVGGTGRTGQRVLEQLLERGVRVRAIVRSASKLAPELARHPQLTSTEASLLALSDTELQAQVRGCDAVISCLGHVISFKGIFGAPRDLVTEATTRLCRAVEALRPSTPVKLVLQTSVSVNHSRATDTRRTAFERLFLWVLRALIPPARDNQRAADSLRERFGGSPFVEWVVVRPDTLMDGAVSRYELHEGLVDSVFSPGHTNMATVAHFMSELVTNAQTWSDWQGKFPVVTNAS